MSRAVCLLVALVGLSIQAHAYNHPSIPNTIEELNILKASTNQEPWKSGYAALAADGHSSLNYTMQGPFATVNRNPNLNLGQWEQDMIAVHNLALMWYFTGNTAYAQKSHDILLAWANTQTSFGGEESGLDLGDYAYRYAGGADLLRGTWPGWTSADTTAVENLFLNVYWPATSNTGYCYGPANKGLLTGEAGIAIATFCDDTVKFNHVIDTYRTYAGAGLVNTLPTGEMGETGRDSGHAYGGLLGMAFVSEVAWKQGVDLYSELDNRLLACGEYYARNTLLTDNPFVPFGTVDYTYYSNTIGAGTYTANRAALYLIQNAYKNRKGLPTPWIDLKIQSQPVDSDNWLYAKTADFTTATPAPASFPAVSLASSGLTLTTLGSNSGGRSSSYANGVWTVTGAGTDVWDDVNDDCQFVYQTMTGDCALVARVTSSQYVTGSTKAGLMIRDNLINTVSQRAWIAILPTPTNVVQSRQKGWTENWGGSYRAVRSDNLPPGGMPYWLKVERRGGMINTYTSQDGTSWATDTSSYYGNLLSTVYIGLFVNSSSTTTTTTATFDHVAFTGGSGGLVTTPAAPAAVFACGSSKAITVRWLPSFGATSYNLLRSTTSGSGYAVIASNLSGTSYVDTSAVAGTTYYYVAHAKNSAGTSGNSPQFYGSLLPAMANLAFSGSSTASVSSGAGYQNSDTAFDGNPGSKWYVGNSPTGWIQYDFGANNAQVVKRYTINSADVATRDPKDWTFQGSNDGSTWTTLDTQSGQLFADRNLQNIYNIGNTTAYRYYQINVTANNGASTLAIAELGLWGDSGHTIPDGRYRIVSRNSNKVIDVSGSSTANGVQLVQSAFNGGSSQLWDIFWQGNGQYRATGVGSGKVIDNGGTSNSGSNLVIQSGSGGTSQLWKVLPDSDGFFRMTSVNSGLVADVNGGSTADGANIIQGTYSGSDSQLWKPSLAGTAPPAPTGLIATGTSSSQISLSWTASTGATGYNVKRATVSGGPYTTISTGVTATSYLDTGLDASTIYYYVVTATNSVGCESGNSPEDSAIPQAAVQAWLKFDETSGTSAADATGNGWTGTLVNSGTWGAGYLNNAVKLSGFSQYVSLPSGVVSSLNDFTVSTWVKLNSQSTWQRVFDFGTGTTKYMFLTTQYSATTGSNNKMRFAITTGGNGAEQQINSTATSGTGTWVHVAVTLSGSTGNLYLNGVLSGSNTGMTLKPSSLGSTTQNYLGKSQYSDPYLNGSLDDFRIYTRALSAGEISLLAAGPLPAPQNVTATPGTSQIALSWNGVSGATSYTIQRASSYGGPYTLLATGVTATSYTDSGLADGTAWYYIIAAQGLPGTGVASSPVSATTYTAVENWRVVNFGTASNSGNAADNADPDGDGMTNAQEYAAGTNPNSAASALRVSNVAFSGNDVVVSFPTVVGKMYRLERSNTLQSGSWTTVQDNIAGTGGTVPVTDVGAAGQGKRFYRIILP